MLAAATSASRHLLQRDASIGACSGSGNRVRSLLTASAITTTYPIRIRKCYSDGYGISFNNPKHRTRPSLLFAVKGFLSDSSNSNSPHGRVTRPYLPHLLMLVQLSNFFLFFISDYLNNVTLSDDTWQLIKFIN